MSAKNARVPSAKEKKRQIRAFPSFSPVPEPKAAQVGVKPRVLSKVSVKYKYHFSFFVSKSISYINFYLPIIPIVAYSTKTKEERQKGRDRRGT